MKLKLTGLIVGDVELTKRKYLHPNTTASPHTATIFTTSNAATATEAKATTVNSTATSTTSATKTKGIQPKIFGYIETVWN